MRRARGRAEERHPDVQQQVVQRRRAVLAQQPRDRAQRVRRDADRDALVDPVRRRERAQAQRRSEHGDSAATASRDEPLRAPMDAPTSRPTSAVSFPSRGSHPSYRANRIPTQPSRADLPRFGADDHAAAPRDARDRRARARHRSRSAARGRPTFANPVLPGDHPDPTVVRAGGRVLRERDERVVGADLPRLPLDGSRPLAPGRRRAARRPALGRRQLLGPRAGALVGAHAGLLLRQPPRRDAVPRRGERRAARGPVARPRAGALPAGRDHRRRSVHRRRRQPLAAVQAPRQRATASTRCASASDGCAPWATRTSSSPPTRPGSRASPRGPRWCAAAAPTCSSTPAGTAAARRAPTRRASPARRRSSARTRRTPPIRCWPATRRGSCPGHGTTIDLGAAGSLPAAPRLPRRRRLRPPALRAARPHRLRRRRLAHDRGRPGPRGHRPGSARRQRGPTAPPASPTASAAGSLAPGWEWPFFAVPDARPEHGALRLTCRASASRAELPRPPGPGRPLHGRGHRRRPPPRRPRGRARRARSGARPARHRGARRIACAPSAPTTAASALGPATRAPAGARLRLLLSATPDGTVALYAAGAGGAPPRIAGGPAETGLPATRVALTCRGTGATRVDTLVTHGAPSP